MWPLLAQEASSSAPLSLGDLLGYGIAAPFIIYLLWDGRRKDKAKEDADDRITSLTERLLDQQAEALPLLQQATQTLAAATQLLADRRSSRGDGGP